MGKVNESKKSEYGAIISKFLKEDAITLEEYLCKASEVRQDIIQRERILEVQNNQSDPNSKLFSPIVTNSLFSQHEEDVAFRDELEQRRKLLIELEQHIDRMKTRCQELERVKKYLLPKDDNDSNLEKLILDSNALQNYSYKLLETQELDRNRIARDLHDSTVQDLTGLVHKTELCAKLIDMDPTRVKLELQTMTDVLKQSINDMREIIYDLRPMALDNLGLVTATESFCNHIGRMHELPIEIKVSGKEPKLLPIVSVTLYRIIQEACNNIVKHADAKHGTVMFSFSEHLISVCIMDDGIGFDPSLISSDDELHGFGLSTMQQRTSLLNGKFFIEGKKKIGTKVLIDVPI